MILSDNASTLGALTEASDSRSIHPSGLQYWEVSAATLEVLEREHPGRYSLRDYHDLIAMNGWVIDSRVGDPGALPAGRAEEPGEHAKQLYIVQFVAPPRDDWLDDLRERFQVEFVEYLPYNAYIAIAAPDAYAELAQEAGTRASWIQWVGNYHSAYRISQFLESTIALNSSVDVAIKLVNTPEGRVASALVREQALKNYGHDKVMQRSRVIRVRVTGSSLPELAKRPEVLWIEPASTSTSLDERISQTVAGNVFVESGSERPVAPPLDGTSGYWNWLVANGMTGDFGFSIDISDEGFDLGDEADILPHFESVTGSSRVSFWQECFEDQGSTVCVGDYQPTNLFPDDRGIGHGTIVASTAAGYDLGNQPVDLDELGYRYGLGVAPTIEIGVSKHVSLGLIDVPYGDMTEFAYTSGARLSNNSWGFLGFAAIYNIDAQMYDGLVRDASAGTAGNQELGIVFAAGNDGDQGAGSLAPPGGTAKNVITVGGSENYRPAIHISVEMCGGEEDADDTRDLWGSSSRGPTTDGRSKPDIVAPASRAIGIASRAICDQPFENRCCVMPQGGGNEEFSSCCEPPSPGMNCCPSGEFTCTDNAPPDCSFLRDPRSTHNEFKVLNGTSFAAPAVTGAAALGRRYFVDTLGVAAPSPAMLKAFLIATSTYLTGDGANDSLPSNSQGFGRVDLGRALDGSDVQMVDQSVVFSNSGATYTLTGSVQAGSKPLRIVLAWTDAPGSTVGAAWNNNLDLEVDIGGQRYLGNCFAGDTSAGYTIGGGEVQPCVADPRNNVEAVFLPAGTTGAYTITVRATNVNSDGLPANPGTPDPTDQDFALFVYNGAM